MTAPVMEPETQTDDGLNSHLNHAFCGWCWPTDSVLPDMIPALCGALVLTATIPEPETWFEVYAVPPNPCDVCLAATGCKVCGGGTP